MRNSQSNRRPAHSRLLVFQRLEPRLPLSGAPLVSEFMASNGDSLFDEDGDSSDWLEIYNPTTLPIDLQGWYLTDDPALLTCTTSCGMHAVEPKAR